MRCYARLFQSQCVYFEGHTGSHHLGADKPENCLQWFSDRPGHLGSVQVNKHPVQDEIWHGPESDPVKLPVSAPRTREQRKKGRR